MKSVCYYFVFLSFMILSMNATPLKASNGQIMFVARMNTDNEVPMVRGDALGMVTFLLSEDRKEVLIHGLFTNLTGAVLGCNLHQGFSGANGPVFLDLSTFVSGNRIKANIPLPAGFIQMAQNGQIYINVHTAGHPNGEIRGQLVMKSEYIIPVIASGSYVVPPDSTPTGFALGTLRYSQNLTRMQYQILPVGLSGPVTAAQLRIGSPGSNGDLLADLVAGDFITGTIEDTSIVKNSFAQLTNNMAYITISTSAKPTGEIRADLSFNHGINSSALLNGDQEVPPVTTTAKAYAITSINATLDTLRYTMGYTGITPIGAHIHQAAVGIDGPVVIPLNLLIPGIYSGKTVLGDDVFTSFLKDELYFNIHSSANPNGEIRGQSENNIMNSFTFDLCGDQEAPKKNVNGYGAAYVAINKANTEMDYGIITDGVNGDATTTRLYDGAFGANGTTLLSLDLPNPVASKAVPITGVIATKINADRGYINNHTAANPAGEIRGQVRRVLSCKINTANEQVNSQNSAFIQNYNNQTIYLESNLDKNINAIVVLSDLTGNRLMQWNTLFPAGFSKTSYDVSSISNGFYLMNVIKENNNIQTFKIIKI